VGRLFNKFIKISRPLVWGLARAYDLKIQPPLYASGQYPLIIKGSKEQALNSIPKSVYFNTRSGQIVIGENAVFGEDVKLLTGKHMNVEEANRSKINLHSVPESGRDIEIGKDCYIGSGAIIVGPVIVGDYAVVGAGSVVTKNVPDYAFVAGVPAKLVRMLSKN